MRSRLEGHRLKGDRCGNLRQIEAVLDDRKPAGGIGRQTAEIERQAIAQQLDPILLTGPECLFMGPIIRPRIMANADCLLPCHKGLDSSPIGPLALCKQQMQLCGLGALRL